MGLITPNELKTFKNLYTQQIRYLLSTEMQIGAGLKSMMSHTADHQLKQAFQSHMQETEVQAKRLETLVAEMNNGGTDDKKDPIMTALIASSVNIVRESKEGPIRDAGILATAQKINHYKIASYGAAHDWAKILGYSKHAQTLEKTLEEEKHADELLTSISHHVNTDAVNT